MFNCALAWGRETCCRYRQQYCRRRTELRLNYSYLRKNKPGRGRNVKQFSLTQALWFLHSNHLFSCFNAIRVSQSLITVSCFEWFGYNGCILWYLESSQNFKIKMIICLVSEFHIFVKVPCNVLQWDWKKKFPSSRLENICKDNVRVLECD